MPRFIGDPIKEGANRGTLGVLVVNLGTPDAPTASAVRRYLKQFLGDPRVIELPRALWWLILNGVILNLRPRKSAAAYKRVWTEDGSPLLLISEKQAEALQRELSSRFGDGIRVALGMTYGNPSIFDALESLRAQEMRRLLILPLYPQYSGSSTGPVFDTVTKVLQRWRWVPAIRFVNDYYDAPGYIAALADSVKEFWSSHPERGHLLLSFHGIPKRYVAQGDPYLSQCHVTGQLLSEKLGLGEKDWSLSFQSRVGTEEWLRPYTDETLTQWGSSGPKRVDVLCPGFAADCLETLEEIAMENRETFLEAGGESLRYIPALNDRPDHVAFMADLVAHHCQGWPEVSAKG